MTIKEQIGRKPSVALTAMMDGLLEQMRSSDFVLSMATYGVVEDGVCFGCAATCALLKLRWCPAEMSKEDFLEGRYDGDPWDKRDTVNFEGAIDLARKGDLSDLFQYCGIDPAGVPGELRFFPIWIQNDNVNEAEGMVRDCIRELEEAGY